LKIAFLGLGRMGSGMAQNLLRAGHGFVSAPVFGRPEATAAGKLRVVAAKGDTP